MMRDLTNETVNTSYTECYDHIHKTTNKSSSN